MKIPLLACRLAFAVAGVWAVAGPAFAGGDRANGPEVNPGYGDFIAASQEQPIEEAPSSPEVATPASEPETATPAEPAPAPLPDPATVVVVLGTAFDEGTAAVIGAGTQLYQSAPEIVARVTIPLAGDLKVNGRIVAEEAEGIIEGSEMAVAASPEQFGEEQSVTLRFVIPESGLPAGRYRMEVLESGMLARTVAAKVFTTTPAPLTLIANRLKIGLHEAESAPDELTHGDLSTRPSRLFATLETLEPTTLRLTAHLLAEEAQGIRRESVVALSRGDALAELRPGANRSTVEIALPRMGLPAGRYRIEFREALAPRRVVKSEVFTTREPPEMGEFDLADPENGGLLESVSGERGAGLTWAWMTLRPHNTKEWTYAGGQADEGLACDFVISFFKREPALVSMVEVTPASESAPIASIEVWGSMLSAKDGFQKVAEQTFTEAGGEPRIVTLPPTQMRFIKIRLQRAQGVEPQLGLRTVRVFEASAPDYESLRRRQPGLSDWKFQPRHAAQQGLYFLQASAVEFQRVNNCMGCHVQSQALMGLTVGRRNDYVVSDVAERELADFTAAHVTPLGDVSRSKEGDPQYPDRTNSIFGGLALAYAESDPKPAKELMACARWLAGQQTTEGELWPDSEGQPVTQGAILQTVQTMTVWAQALVAGGDPTLAQNITRALEWLKEVPAETTQDKVFKILAWVRHGGPAEKKLARQLGLEVLAEQHQSGAWSVNPNQEKDVDSPFATGQVLYALRQAGFGTNTPAFRRGVEWLLLRQSSDSSWPDSHSTSPFASTMWPVIALTGSFSRKAEPARLFVTALPPPPPPPVPAPVVPAVVSPTVAPPNHILLVFDCSFSMTEKIRQRSKFDVAKDVLRELIHQLPAESKVGLRLYGHRYSSINSRSRTDTELVVPIGPLDREKLRSAITAADAQGQTPLVFSTIQAAEDLKKVGGGIVIVVTDGEESCGGRPREAGKQLAALGVPLRLEVIGFALTGRRVVDEMTAFTAPTGGRFRTASDALQLAAALKAAVVPGAATALVPPPPPPPPAPIAEDLPVAVFDAQGVLVAKGSTLGEELPELAPGTYRVELRDGGKIVTLDQVKLAESQTLQLRYNPATGKLGLWQEN